MTTSSVLRAMVYTLGAAVALSVAGCGESGSKKNEVQVHRTEQIDKFTKFRKERREKQADEALQTLEMQKGGVAKEKDSK